MKLMTYNVMLGGVKPPSRLEQVLRVIQDQDADVIGLQEINMGQIAVVEALPERKDPRESAETQRRQQEKLAQEQVRPRVLQPDTPPGKIIQLPSALPEGGVERFGDVTFNARKHELGAYIRTLKHRIWLKWFPMVEFKYNSLAITSKTAVGFKVQPDGSLGDIQIVEHRGDEYLKAIATSAVSEAAPFDPLPEGFESLDGEDTLDIVFTFHYY